VVAATSPRMMGALLDMIGTRLDVQAPAWPITVPAEVPLRSLPSFADHLAVVPDFLPAGSFAALASEAERLVAPERSFVPTHKQGGTVAYETLIAAAPAIVACYHSIALRDILSRLIGTPIRPRRSTTGARSRYWSTTNRATISAGTTITTSTAAGTSRCCSRSKM
jgi:hypothetical protein